jgi:hypothetical protein
MLANTNIVWFQLYNNQFCHNNNIPTVVQHEKSDWKQLYEKRLDCDQFLVPCQEHDIYEREERSFTSNFECFSYSRDSSASLSTFRRRLAALTEFLQIERHDMNTVHTILGVIAEITPVMQQFGMFCDEIATLTTRWTKENRASQKIEYLRKLREFFHYEKFHRGCSSAGQSMTVQCIVPLLLEGEMSMVRFDGFFSSEGRENPTGELVLDIPDQEESIFLHFSKNEDEKKQSLADFHRLKQLMHLGHELNDEELFEVIRCCFMPLTHGSDEFKSTWRNMFSMSTLKF